MGSFIACHVSIFNGEPQPALPSTHLWAQYYLFGKSFEDSDGRFIGYECKSPCGERLYDINGAYRDPQYASSMCLERRYVPFREYLAPWDTPCFG